ncbi:MAG: 50S ribosomal protein L22 [Armatimonadetes bacterium]|jgi:large subunit ribosomal protein L22|nr:50S ribosomal protein L22 [Armatimonadota bacterium]MDI9582726.1 50S ribosomal protein L22 [Acidobacteriota bacterium]
MEVQAISKWVRKGPRKVRGYAELIRGKTPQQAQAILGAVASPSAQALLKTLNSAIANAENNHDLDPEDMVVSKAFVDGGFTIPRMIARARGRGDRIRKRTCHITVVLSDEQGKDES